MIPWWLWLLAGAAAYRVIVWLFDTYGDPMEPAPKPIAEPAPPRGALLVVLTRANPESQADITVALKGERERWN